MKILALSDTHSRHKKIPREWLPPADVIVHAGDFTINGEDLETLNFLEWFSGLPYAHRILTAGNHDWSFEDTRCLFFEDYARRGGITYLNDEGLDIEGVYFYGSASTPRFLDWAFNREQGAEIDRYWRAIPRYTDVLITHGPPYGYLDETLDKRKVGCKDLTENLKEIKPKYHVFGHIHSGYGIMKGRDELEGTTFINASVCDERYKLVNKPILFEV